VLQIMQMHKIRLTIKLLLIRIMSRIIIIILIIVIVGVIVIVINNDLIKNSFLMKGLSTTFRQVQFYDQLRSVEC